MLTINKIWNSKTPFRDLVQLEPVLNGTGLAFGIDCLNYRGHRFLLRNGRLNTAVCVGVLELSGWKFHAAEARLYFFTSPEGESVHMSLRYMRTLVTAMLFADRVLAKQASLKT